MRPETKSAVIAAVLTAPSIEAIIIMEHCHQVPVQEGLAWRVEVDRWCSTPPRGVLLFYHTEIQAAWKQECLCLDAPTSRAWTWADACQAPMPEKGHLVNRKHWGTQRALKPVLCCLKKQHRKDITVSSGVGLDSCGRIRSLTPFSGHNIGKTQPWRQWGLECIVLMSHGGQSSLSRLCPERNMGPGRNHRHLTAPKQL